MFKKLLLVSSGKMSLNPAGYLAYLAPERNPQRSRRPNNVPLHGSKWPFLARELRIAEVAPFVALVASTIGKTST